MRDRPGLGPLIGMGLLLAAMVGFSALAAGRLPATSGDTTKAAESLPLTASAIALDCADLLTPDRLGPGDVQRYGIEDKLEDNQFRSLPFGDYTLCVYPAAAGERFFKEDDDRLDESARAYIALLDADIYYLFDTTTGALALRKVEGTGRTGHAPAPSPIPTITAVPAAAADSPVVCIELDAPIEIDGQEYDGLSIADILGGEGCGATLTGDAVCWEWPCPPNDQSSSDEPGSGGPCIDMETALAMSGKEGSSGASTAAKAGDDCWLSLGGGNQVCWYCTGPVDEPPPPAPTPTGPYGAAATCRDLVTPESVGAEDYERFGLTELLQKGHFGRKVCEGAACIICWANRTIDGAEVLGDELYYRFALPTGKLTYRRIHWREDLPEHLPSNLISRQEAEAMVGGALGTSYLAIISPDATRFGGLVSGRKGKDGSQQSRPAYDRPVWLVRSEVAINFGGRQKEVTRVSAVDAVAGEVLGHTDLY